MVLLLLLLMMMMLMITIIVLSPVVLVVVRVVLSLILLLFPTAQHDARCRPGVGRQWRGLVRVDGICSRLCGRDLGNARHLLRAELFDDRRGA